MSFFFFFKQKTAYEVRISDWSSDVCSSDLRARCGKSERNRGEGRRPRRLLSFPMGGGTVPRGQFHHVRAMPCHRRMLLRSGVRQETASRSGATNGRQASCEIHRLSYSSFVYNCVGRRPDRKSVVKGKGGSVRVTI